MGNILYICKCCFDKELSIVDVILYRKKYKYKMIVYEEILSLLKIKKRYIIY